ncbi:hypothetical protein NN561_019926 [Cricetulus griseus]
MNSSKDETKSQCLGDNRVIDERPGELQMGFSSSATERGRLGDSVSLRAASKCSVSYEAGSAVCACPRAPPKPTIPTRPFPPLPSPSLQPRILRLRGPPRFRRGTEGQPSHSLAEGAGIRRAVPRPSPSSRSPQSLTSPEEGGAPRGVSAQPGQPCSSLVVTRREGGRARAPAVAPPRADRRLRDTGAQRQQHARTGLGLGGSTRG